MTWIQSVVNLKEKSVKMRLREFLAEPFLYKSRYSITCIMFFAVMVMNMGEFTLKQNMY